MSSTPTTITATSLPSTSIFPLPLLPIPPASLSASRRVRQSASWSRVVINTTNATIKALNTLYFNYPSLRYARVLSSSVCESTVPSFSQQRLLNRLVESSKQYLLLRRLGCRSMSSAVTVDINSSSSSCHCRSATLPGHAVTILNAPSGSFSFSRSGAHFNADSDLASLFLFPTVSASELINSMDPVPSLSTPTSQRPYSSPHVASWSVPDMESLNIPNGYATSAGIVHLIADSVSLPSSLSHLPLINLLPSPICHYYLNPQSVLLPADQRLAKVETANLPFPQVLAERSEYVKLVMKMVGLGMLGIITDPICVNGLFGVPKEDDTIRLILDARPANCWFSDPPSVSLPSPSHLSHIVVAETDRFTVAKLDLSNFYHNLLLPSWMLPYFSLPSLSTTELSALQHLPNISPAILTLLNSDAPLYPCCTTLPMGWSHSVFLAQCIHENVLYSYSSLSPANNIINMTTLYLNRSLHAIYIDDLILLSPSNSAGDVVAANVMYDEVRTAYATVGMLVNQKKCQPPTTSTVTVLGVDINGSTSTLSLSPARHSKVMLATSQLLSNLSVSGKLLAAVIGSWTWELLLCRPSLCSLKHSYRWIEKYMDSPPHQLWPSVRRELMVLLALSPLLVTNLRDPLASKIIASDSSSYGAGVVTTNNSVILSTALLPFTASSFCSLLQQTQQSHSQPSSVLLSETGPTVADIIHLISQPAILYRHRHIDTTAILSFLPSLLPTLSWSTVISSEWKNKGEHINSLELQSILLALRWCLSHPHSPHTRQLLLTDSSVAFHILLKGRSSSPSLLSLYRRISSLLLASGISILPIWIPSALNPADEPSRSMSSATIN